MTSTWKRTPVTGKYLGEKWSWTGWSWWWRHRDLSKRRELFIYRHVVMSQKTWNYRNIALRTTNFTTETSCILVEDIQGNINTGWAKSRNASFENTAQLRGQVTVNVELIRLQHVLNVAQHRHVTEVTYVIWNVLSMGLYPLITHVQRDLWHTLYNTSSTVTEADTPFLFIIRCYAGPYGLGS
jgi:hypothetical protein